ncbi:MAG: exodeoxyribonuclease VII small subunit [Mariprofundaceae bacterium]
MSKSDSTSPEIEKLSFEQALEQLTDLESKLESGKLPLEESVTAFESGVQLSRRCESLLDHAEQRLQILNDPLNDQPSE